jgi:nitrate/TMAO reductase-like tetraheme cytochrome c subunit
MKDFFKHRSSFFIVAGLIAGMLIFTKCMDNQTQQLHASVTADYKAYAGSATCATCHKTIVESHVKTNHFKTSAIANASNILGSFDSGLNVFPVSPSLKVVMEKKAEQFFEISVGNGEVQRREPIDIIVGSGANGQSYESWQNKSLVQLPISYFTSANQWCNSPGHFFSVIYDRPITSRCIECHATFAEKISEQNTMPEEFDKGRMILGVDCERCHGPAAKHVEYQQQHPLEKTAKYVINPASFTRQQSLDLCSLCHRAGLQGKEPSFTFTAGNKLADFFKIDTSAAASSDIDVHGNQYGLLSQSKCFKKSGTITCLTCHNTHENQTGATGYFSQKCMSCHNDQHPGALLCKVKNATDEIIKNNCTSCHMPKLASSAIAVVLHGEDKITPAMIHTHLIKVYPEESKNVLAFIRNKK